MKPEEFNYHEKYLHEKLVVNQDVSPFPIKRALARGSEGEQASVDKKLDAITALTECRFGALEQMFQQHAGAGGAGGAGAGAGGSASGIGAGPTPRRPVSNFFNGEAPTRAETLRFDEVKQAVEVGQAAPGGQSSFGASLGNLPPLRARAAADVASVDTPEDGSAAAGPGRTLSEPPKQSYGFNNDDDEFSL